MAGRDMQLNLFKVDLLLYNNFKASAHFTISSGSIEPDDRKGQNRGFSRSSKKQSWTIRTCREAHKMHHDMWQSRDSGMYSMGGGGQIDPSPTLGTMIFRDRGKRTENTESTLGNGKRIFKRKNTEMYF